MKRSRNKGSANINWRGGVAEYLNHYLMKKQRLIILMRNPKCERCKKPATEIHHKDLTKSNHKLSNLMAVCHKCNCFFHRGPRKEYRSICLIKYGKSLTELKKEFNISVPTIYYRIKNNIPFEFPKYLSALRKESNSKYRRLYGMTFLELIELGKEKYNLRHWEIVRKLKRKEYPFKNYLKAEKAKQTMNRIATLAILFFFCLTSAFAFESPQNLWQGLIAEDTSGNLQTYRIIASVCRNRLANGLNLGLVALRRKGLDDFVKCNRAYVLAKRGVDLRALATQAINETFRQNQDFAFGATHYEHTKVYPTPKWAKDMEVVKIVYEGTKQEITLWRAK